MNIAWVTDIIASIKDMAIKKIIVIFICLYPIFAALYFKDELKLILINDTIELVEVKDINSMVKRTHEIKDRFNASAVLVFVYQPQGDKKVYKERVCYVGDSRNLFYELQKADLIEQPMLLEELKNKNYLIVDKYSNNELSHLITAYNVECVFVKPIKNSYGLIIAEVMIVFDSEISKDSLNDLIDSIELISLSM